MKIFILIWFMILIVDSVLIENFWSNFCSCLMYSYVWLHNWIKVLKQIIFTVKDCRISFKIILSTLLISKLSLIQITWQYSKCLSKKQIKHLFMKNKKKLSFFIFYFFLSTFIKLLIIWLSFKIILSVQVSGVSKFNLSSERLLVDH